MSQCHVFAPATHALDADAKESPCTGVNFVEGQTSICTLCTGPMRYTI